MYLEKKIKIPSFVSQNCYFASPNNNLSVGSAYSYGSPRLYIIKTRLNYNTGFTVRLACQLHSELNSHKFLFNS